MKCKAKCKDDTQCKREAMHYANQLCRWHKLEYEALRDQRYELIRLIKEKFGELSQESSSE